MAGEGRIEIKAEELIQRYGAGERDFAGVDIEKEFLGLLKVDPSGADLREANLAGADLATTGFFPEADLSRISLAYANLEEADLRQTVLYATGTVARHGMCVNVSHANLRGAQVGPSFPVELVAVRPDGTEMAVR